MKDRDGERKERRKHRLKQDSYFSPSFLCKKQLIKHKIYRKQ